MPSKSANVKNEKQYEALKDKGMSKERAAKIAKLAQRLQERWEEVGLWRQRQAGWHHRPAQGGRPQGGEGGGQEELSGAISGQGAVPELAEAGVEHPVVPVAHQRGGQLGDGAQHRVGGSQL
jgi:hypothetical protein